MALLKAMIINKSKKASLPIMVMFNPPSLKIKRVTRYADLKTLNTEAAKKQFIKPENDTLTVDLFYDTSAIPFVPVGPLLQPIFDLAAVPEGKTEPPKIIFVWGDLVFPGYIASVEQNSDFFSFYGMAQRATLSIVIVRCEFDPEGIKFDDKK
ncbi:MAG: hypothetical protein LBB91_01930 [Clostridiales bacterium]|jgi:hypothetical protein|nr:hypothetical protein [Clostridiales bacterium]